jgi:hypothetical protein
MSKEKPYQRFFTWRTAILESSLPATTRHVLLTLSCHMNDAGESCFPSIERLSRETGLSTRSVSTHLGKAREAGWIKSGLHGYGGRQWARNEYRISWPPSWGEEPSSVPRPDGLESDGEQRSPAGGEPSSTQGDSQNGEEENVAVEGGERNDREAWKDGQTISPVNSSNKSSSGKAAPCAEFANQHIQRLKKKLKGASEQKEPEPETNPTTSSERVQP